ncbi:MAG: aspartate carbamoyltransferase [Nanoarchaeota archaeon]
MKLEHFIESQQLNDELILEFFKKADELRRTSAKEIYGLLERKILLSLFYEPSTRTRLSFESAMIRMGGKVLTTENAKEFSSAVKGESLEDSIRVISKYTDCIVIRHQNEGAAKIAASISSVPVINAGDGGGQHPTQALLDIYSIYKEIGRLDNLKIAMIGDLEHGRTVRSLSYILGKYKSIEIIFVSPEDLRMKEDIKDYLGRHNVNFREESDLNKVLPEADVVYMTRIQKERMNLERYNSARGKYIINSDNFWLIKPSARLMHPLPHTDEIDLSLETEQNDERVAYFRQAENGLYIRMALLNYLLGD